MRIYFVKNNKYYSKFLMWLLDEPVSHIGIGFFNDSLNLVVESTKPYGRMRPFEEWHTKYQVVYYADIQITKEEEETLYKKTYDYIKFKPYAWKAYYYALYVCIMHKLFKMPLPTKNIFNTADKDFCTEIVAPLKDFLKNIGADLTDKDLAAMSPHMVGQELYRQTLANRKVTWYGL